MKITKRRIQAEVTFIGSGKLTGVPHSVIRGGVPEPKLSGETYFTVASEPPDENFSPGLERAFQINVFGTSNDYRKIGEYFLSLAELDTTIDTNFHEHLRLITRDNTTGIHLILRKDDTGDFT